MLKLWPRPNLDGETLLVNASVHVTYPALFKQVGFDVIKDFAPITQLTRVPMLLAINPSCRYMT